MYLSLILDPAKTLILLCRSKGHLCAVLTSQSKRKTLLKRPRVSTLNPLKLPHNTRDSITRFRQGKLLANTDPGASIEGNISPSWLDICPSLRSIPGFIGPIHFKQTVHAVYAVEHFPAVWNEYAVFSKSRFFYINLIKFILKLNWLVSSKLLELPACFG